MNIKLLIMEIEKRLYSYIRWVLTQGFREDEGHGFAGRGKHLVRGDGTRH